MKYRAVIV